MLGRLSPRADEQGDGRPPGRAEVRVVAEDVRVGAAEALVRGVTAGEAFLVRQLAEHAGEHSYERDVRSEVVGLDVELIGAASEAGLVVIDHGERELARRLRALEKGVRRVDLAAPDREAHLARGSADLARGDRLAPR